MGLTKAFYARAQRDFTIQAHVNQKWTFSTARARDEFVAEQNRTNPGAVAPVHGMAAIMEKTP